MVDEKVLANFKGNDRQQTVSNPVEAVVISEINKFFDAMVAEFSSTDNGVDFVLDEYDVEKGLQPFVEYYLKNKISL